MNKGIKWQKKEREENLEKEIVEEDEYQEENTEFIYYNEEIKTKKCSLSDHIEKDAFNYCQECKIYMFNKCEEVHNSLFKNHHFLNLDKNSQDIFTGICKERNHLMKLEYFCKNHNQLCCAACIAKIRSKGNGKHKNCVIYSINKIKNIKKNKLKEKINILEKLSDTLEGKVDSLKRIFEIINENKDLLIAKIQRIFTKIRSAFNDREDELLSEVDKKYDKLFFNENLIKECEILPNKIKNSLEKGKGIIDSKDWDNDYLLNSVINDCINIEYNIDRINLINNKIEQFKSNEVIKIGFKSKIGEIDGFLENIKKFGELFSEQISKNKLLSNLLKKNNIMLYYFNYWKKGNK